MESDTSTRMSRCILHCRIANLTSRASRTTFKRWCSQERPVAQRCKSSEFFSTLAWGAAIDIRSAIHRLGHPVLGLACSIYLKFSVLWLTVLWRRSSGNSPIQPLFCESGFRCIWQLSCPFLRRPSIKASSTNLSRASSPHSPTTTTSLNCFVTSHSRICHIPVLLIMPSAVRSQLQTFAVISRRDSSVASSRPSYFYHIVLLPC